MDWLQITRITAIAGTALGLLGILARLREILNRPFKKDLSRPAGSQRRGVLYAFTLGMAPWEKESTRLHWLAYLRGVLFHIGVFAAFAVLIVSPWLAALPAWLVGLAVALTAAGALAGFAGLPMRWMEPNTRALSLPDDYFSVFLVSLFAALASLSLLLPAALPFFYIIAALMAVYVPFSKIRHCVYFFYSKFFFGLGFGRRGVIGQPKSKYVE